MDEKVTKILWREPVMSRFRTAHGRCIRKSDLYADTIGLVSAPCRCIFQPEGTRLASAEFASAGAVRLRASGARNFCETTRTENMNQDAADRVSWLAVDTGGEMSVRNGARRTGEGRAGPISSISRNRCPPVEHEGAQNAQ